MIQIVCEKMNIEVSCRYTYGKIDCSKIVRHKVESELFSGTWINLPWRARTLNFEATCLG